MKTPKNIFADYELDFLFEPHELWRVVIRDSGHEYLGEKVKIYRDEDLHLKYKIRSLEEGQNPLKTKRYRQGEFADFNTIVMKPRSELSMEWTLSGAFLRSWGRHSDTKLFYQRGVCGRIEFGNHSDPQDEQITYLIGAPKFNLTRTSKHSINIHASISRSHNEVEKVPEWKNELLEEGWGLDWSLLNTSLGNIVIGRPIVKESF